MSNEFIKEKNRMTDHIFYAQWSVRHLLIFIFPLKTEALLLHKQLENSLKILFKDNSFNLFEFYTLVSVLILILMLFYQFSR